MAPDTLSRPHASTPTHRPTNGHAGPSPAAEPPVLTGAQIVIECLKAEAVEFVFGYPGGAVIPIYDQLYGVTEFQHVLVRHEQGAAHAAEGYAKATGKVGVVLVTSGPGATNTVTGIADAFMDSVPIVVITGQVPFSMIGNDAFQEADIVGITRPITKHNYLVRDVRDIARVMKEAFHIARTGRPGPVLIDLPKDIQLQSCPFVYPDSVSLRGYKPTYDGHLAQVRRAAELIAEAKQPVLYVGGGTIFSDAAPELLELAHRANVPVTTTLHGLGAFPETDPLSLGMLGMHGTWAANQAVFHSDLLIAVGARFDDRVTGKLATFAPTARIIHLDIDPASISKNVVVDVPIVGDVKRILQKLNPLVTHPSETSGWLERIAGWKAECPLGYSADDGALRPQFIIEQIDRRLVDGGIVVTDVGQNQMWAAQFFTYRRPRTHITSGGLGTMGFSLPAAIGACFAMRDRQPVVSINGDGGFQMNMQELVTAAAYGLPLKVVILNNGFLGMVRQWQELFQESRFSHTDLEATNPDFVKLAEAMHCVGLRASHPDEVAGVLDQAFAIHDRPVVMEFRVVKEEMVFPIVPAGASMTDMITARSNPDTFV